VAGGHESGHGLFSADISMTEAQEAAKGYHFSPSSPSTSPTPSPPPAAAAGDGGDATPTPLAWSLGGDKPTEAAGNNGVQTAAQTEHANLSSGRRRGRPRGSGRRQILATLGQYAPSNAKRPHFLLQQLKNFIFFSSFLQCLFPLLISVTLLGWGPVGVMCMCFSHSRGLQVKHPLPVTTVLLFIAFIFCVINC